MDSANLRDMIRICGGDFDGKMHIQLEYAGKSDDVANPWYTRDFETTWQDVEAGCKGLLAALKEEKTMVQSR